MSSDLDLLSLARVMLCVQTSFIEKRIIEPKYRKVFKDTALCFINISLNKESVSSIEDLRNEIVLLKASIANDKPTYLSSLFNDSYKYRVLAADMAEDIVSSLLSRFVSGDSKTYLNFFDIKTELC